MYWANDNFFESAAFNLACCDSIYVTPIGESEIMGTCPNYYYAGVASQAIPAGYPAVLASFHWNCDQNYYLKDSYNDGYGILYHPALGHDPIISACFLKGNWQSISCFWILLVNCQWS